MATKGITGVLLDMMRDAISAMRSNLKRNDKNSSGTLYKTLEPLVDVKETFVYEAEVLTDANYYDYVDKGVKGHGRGKGKPNKAMKALNSPYQFKVGPPVKFFSDWIKTKPVMASSNAAYPMAKSAGRYGMSGSGFIADGEKAAMQQKHIDALQEAYSAKIEEQLYIMTNGNN